MARNSVVPLHLPPFVYFQLHAFTMHWPQLATLLAEGSLPFLVGQLGG